MMDYNQPRIEALPTGTTKDKEVAKFFREYMEESSLPSYRKCFRDTKYIHQKGCWTPKGIIASQRILTPTGS